MTKARNTKNNRKKSGERKFTYEILPPGTLKRKSFTKQKKPSKRWEEIFDICAETISENAA